MSRHGGILRHSPQIGDEVRFALRYRTLEASRLQLSPQILLAYNHFVSKQSNFWTLQDRVLSALDRWRVGQPNEFILRHAGNRLTMQTAAMERVPDSLVPPWVTSARPMEPGTAARIHGIYNARE